MAYSSVDTRTLATARAHEDMLAGRRAPVEFVVEDLPAPPAVVAAPPISPPTARSRVAAQTSERPTPAIVPAPRPVPPTRMEVARRTPPVEAARRSGPEPLGAGERSTPPRRVPDRPDSPAYARIDRSNAPTIVDRQDAAALDDRWQRRELWFRERLQAR